MLTMETNTVKIKITITKSKNINHYIKIYYLVATLVNFTTPPNIPAFSHKILCFETTSQLNIITPVYIHPNKIEKTSNGQKYLLSTHPQAITLYPAHFPPPLNPACGILNPTLNPTFNSTNTNKYCQHSTNYFILTVISELNTQSDLTFI